MRWILLLTLLLLSSCMTYEKLAQKCAATFPAVDSTKVITLTMLDTLLLPDTLLMVIDTTFCPPGLTDTLRVVDTIRQRIPGKTITRILQVRDTIQVRTDAKLLRALESQLAGAQADVQRYKASRNAARWFALCIGLIGVLALTIPVMVKKR